jgi:hypothetical protein
VCLECKELHDAVTELKVPATNALSSWKLKSSGGTSPKVSAKPPTFQAALNRLMFPGVKRFRWLRFKAACPAAAQHRVKEWQQPGKCPKCGYFLEGNAVPFRRWD